VGEYVQAGALAKERFLGVRNLGIRSADELDVLVREFAAKTPPESGQPWCNSSEEIPKTLAARALLLSLFAGFRFPDVFLEGPMSARLAKALRGNTRWESTGLTAFLYQRMRDYCIDTISSRWRVKGENVCGAGGR